MTTWIVLRVQGVLVAFKSLNQLDKTVEDCHITACDKACQVTIRFQCRYRVTKTYTLPFIESESLKVRDSSLQKYSYLSIYVRLKRYFVSGCLPRPTTTATG